ncbi:MAG: DUF748 domain-containing protein [Verrucomicrobia bacterium]|nr:DUF748 domain-containing protein [Verrucomicrobiota bacterium]
MRRVPGLSDRSWVKDRLQRVVKHTGKVSLRRLSTCVGLSLGAMVLAVAVLLFGFGGSILNRYGKAKAERAVALAHPGYALRIGDLDYAIGANRLVAQSVTLSGTNAMLKVGRISLTGVRWGRLLWGTVALADVLAKASLEATNLEATFPQAHYAIRCARLRGSVPGSNLIAEATELRSLVDDEAFFAAHLFRTPRFRGVAPECRVLGLAYGEWLQGKSYRARSVHFSRPSLDALINRDKPPRPFVKSPLMVHEALAAICQPLQVDSLSITNGHLAYCERLAVGAASAVLTFGAVSMSAEGIANRGEATAAVKVQAQGDLMNAGTLKVQMSIPITPPDFSFHYSGSLSAMDLTRLDPFLDLAMQTRIKSGSAQQAAFDIEVTAGQARGRVRGIYRDLVIAVLDKQTGTAKGFDNRVISFLANVLKLRNANAPDASGAMKEGKVDYTRRPEEEFLEFAWYALRSGVLDVISH